MSASDIIHELLTYAVNDGGAHGKRGGFFAQFRHAATPFIMYGLYDHARHFSFAASFHEYAPLAFYFFSISSDMIIIVATWPALRHLREAKRFAR